MSFSKALKIKMVFVVKNKLYDGVNKQNIKKPDQPVVFYTKSFYIFNNNKIIKINKLQRLIEIVKFCFLFNQKQLQQSDCSLFADNIIGNNFSYLNVFLSLICFHDRNTCIIKMAHPVCMKKQLNQHFCVLFTYNQTLSSFALFASFRFWYVWFCISD